MAKTVDALVGTWHFDASVHGIKKDGAWTDDVTVRGSKLSGLYKQTLDCRRGAAGRAVYCHLSTEPPNSGKLEKELLVGYDDEGKVVRVVDFSSTGDIHDHRCAWTDQYSLSCDQLKASSAGQEVSIQLTLIFTGEGHLNFNETATLKDASKTVYAANASRRP